MRLLRYAAVSFICVVLLVAYHVCIWGMLILPGRPKRGH